MNCYFFCQGFDIFPHPPYFPVVKSDISIMWKLLKPSRGGYWTILNLKNFRIVLNIGEDASHRIESILKEAEEIL